MEDIYANVEFSKPVNPKPSLNQTSPRSSQRRLHGAAVLCLGLLTVFLLIGLISLGVSYRDSVRALAAELSTVKANLTEQLQVSNDKLSAVSEERDQLKTNLTEVKRKLHQLQSSPKQRTTCPAGWKTFSCNCYFFSTNTDSWENSRQDCRGRGADLVIIDNRREQEFITQNVKQDTWIGLNDRDREGRWKWPDDTSLVKAYWYPKQPDNGGGNPKWGEEDCVHIIHGAAAEENWNDRRCDDSLKWICAKTP